MVKVHNVEGYEEYTKLLQELQENNSDNTIIILYSGSKGEDGSSWCSDCKNAEPVLDAILEKFEDRDDIILIHVAVGDRPTWKDPQCVFRTDSKIKLSTIPTLIRWGSNKRLEESDCADETLVELLFEDD